MKGDLHEPDTWLAEEQIQENVNDINFLFESISKYKRENNLELHKFWMTLRVSIIIFVLLFLGNFLMFFGLYYSGR